MTTAAPGIRSAVLPAGRRGRLRDILVVALPVVVGGVSGIFTAAAIPT